MNKIVSLKESGTITKIEQLKRLLAYDRDIKNCPNNIDSVYTFLLLSIGVAYYKLADYVHSVEYTRQAINIIHANGDRPQINKLNLVKYYYYLSIYCDSLKLFSQKNEAIDSCISNEMRANTDYHFASLVLQDNVRNLYNKGDYNLCIDRSTLGETLIHKYYRFEDSMSHIFFFSYYKASALRALRRFREEEQFLQGKRTEFMRVKDKDYQGAIYELFGYLYKSKGDYKKAIDYFEKAVYYDKFSRKRQISAEALNEVGMIYSENLDQNRLSLQCYHRALAYARNRELADGHASDSFYILGNVANVYVRMKLFDSAYYFFQKAFDKIKKGINENDMVLHIEDYVNENIAEDVIKLVLDKADAYLQQYCHERSAKVLDNALFIYKIADRLLNGIKTELTELDSKLFWRTYSRRLYEHAIEAAYFKNSISDAFYFFEKSRAVLLNDQLDEQSKIDDDDMLRQAELKRKILMLKRERSFTSLTSSHYIGIQNRLVATQLELAKFGKKIRGDNPLYYQSYFDTSFISLESVQKYLLHEDQKLIELFEGDSAVYALIITSGQSYLRKIDKKDYDNSARIYISYISNCSLLNKKFNDYSSTAHHLYRLIFRNVNLSAGRMIISPDGHYFPFEALVTNTRPLTYFVEDHAVSYTYSARFLLNNFNTNSVGNSQAFMGFAPIQYTGLPALSGSDQSLERMKNYFKKATNFIGTQASKNNFLKEFYKYKIIQLYTHATDSGLNGEPMMYFSDSVLSLSELFYENKPATCLIVLSACETAEGKLYNGEGVFSFNRQFAALGIPSSVSNLWQVDNQSSYHLAELFYKYVANGLPLDIALQKAKKEYRKTFAFNEKDLPYYWAAPILVGQTNKVPMPKDFPWKWTALAAFLFVLFVWGLMRRVARKKSLVR